MSDQNETPAQVAAPDTPETPVPPVPPAPVAQVADETEEIGKDGKPFDATRAQALIEKLQNENKALKPKAKLADELTAAEKKRQDAQKTDLEKAQSERDDAKKDLEATNRKLVALKYNLPDEFASRIIGGTLAEMDADAEKLAKALPKQPQVTISPTNPPGSPAKATPAQWHDFLYNGGPMPGA